MLIQTKYMGCTIILIAILVAAEIGFKDEVVTAKQDTDGPHSRKLWLEMSLECNKINGMCTYTFTKISWFLHHDVTWGKGPVQF